MVTVTNANDVELILDGAQKVSTTGTDDQVARLIVDEFSLTREEDSSLVSGVGTQHSIGITNGDITHNFAFTIMGEDLALFDTVASANGVSKEFSMTARKTNDNDEVEWEYSLPVAKATSEELSASTGDAIEYTIEGIAVVEESDQYKKSDTTSIWT